MSKTLQEHLGYFRLPGRTDLYRRALNSVVNDGDTVADLGCGLGLLGLIAIEAGAGKVWGIDSSPAIQFARETMRRAGLDDRYTCLGESTFQAELPEPVDLLVCDHVGYFGFDYGIIGMVQDARRRMLKPNGRIVPDEVTLMVAPVAGKRGNAIAGRWAEDVIPDQFHWLDHYHRNMLHRVDLDAADLAGNEQVLGCIMLDKDQEAALTFEATLTIDRDATIEGIAGWFDCHLGGGVRMTNSPISKESIGRGNAFLPFNHAIQAAKGSAIKLVLRLSTEREFMSWSVEPDWEEPRQVMTNFKNAILSRADVSKGADTVPSLSQRGEAAIFVLSCVDGKASHGEIAAHARSAFPAVFPTDNSAREFVESTLAPLCSGK